MKKLFIAFIFSTVLFFGLPNFKVNAMSVTYDLPFTAIPDIADLYLGILAGGTYNIDGIESIEELAQKHKESLQGGYHFLQSFAQKLWNWQVEQAGLGNDTLNENSDLVIYVSPSDIAAFMGYNIKWWEREKVPTDVVIVNPPADTSQTILDNIDYINGSGFDFIKNMPITIWHGSFGNVSQSYPSFNGLPLNYSWYTYSSSGTDNPWNKSKFNTLTSALFCSANGIDNIYITFDSINNVYKCTLTKDNTQYNFNENYPIARGDDWNNSNWASPRGALYGNFYTYSDYLSFANCNPWYSGGWSSKTLSNATLDGLFQQLSRYVRNVNIYVDGVLWSNGGFSVPDDYITNPDVIQVGDTGQDTYDVFWPERIEGYGGLSINGFLDWLAQQLGHKDKISLNDLIEDEVPVVIVDDGVNVPTTKPIESDDVTAAPLVIENDTTLDSDPDNPTPSPYYPVPPIPKWNYPNVPNDVQHTVLAEIIDATQKTVPDDLMILIWSTFGLLVVGGLIYILHK